MQSDNALAEKIFFTGIELAESGKHEEAALFFRSCNVLSPNRPSVITNLTSTLINLSQHKEALAILEDANAKDSNDPFLLHNLAVAYYHLDRLDECRKTAHAALKESPDNAAIYLTLGNVSRALGNLSESEDAYKKALSLRRDYAEAKSSLGYLLLGQKRMNEGWDLMEARFFKKVDPVRIPIQVAHLPLWKEATDNKKKLVIHWEQGFGDTIQFLRFIPDVQKLFKKTFIYTQKSLTALCSANEEKIGAITISDEELATLRAEDTVRLPIMSLPYLLSKQKTSIHISDTPYLSVSQLSSANTLPHNKPRIGLVWGGNKNTSKDSKRSLSLLDFAEVLSLHMVNFFSLSVPQKKDEIEALPNCLNRPTIILKDNASFLDTALIIDQLDLLITVDTGVGHLAGALGKEVWMLNRWESEWRWGYPASTSTYWYKKTRIINQTSPDDWSGAIMEIKKLLASKFMT